MYFYLITAFTKTLFPPCLQIFVVIATLLIMVILNPALSSLSSKRVNNSKKLAVKTHWLFF